MSKESDLRAMREARYTARNSGGTPARAARPAVRPAENGGSSAPVDPVAASEALCGHRSMNGRTCTREHGHDAKSHRYS